MDMFTNGHLLGTSFVHPTITPKVPNNQLRNKGQLLFLLFRSTQLVSSGCSDGRTDGRMDEWTVIYLHV